MSPKCLNYGRGEFTLGHVSLLPSVNQLGSEADLFQQVRGGANLLVLRTPPGGAPALCAALDAENWKEVAGSVAGDNTILLITASRKACLAIQRRIQEELS